MKFNKKIDPKNIKFRVEEDKVLQLKEIIRIKGVLFIPTAEHLLYVFFFDLNICFV